LPYLTPPHNKEAPSRNSQAPDAIARKPELADDYVIPVLPPYSMASNQFTHHLFHMYRKKHPAIKLNALVYDMSIG
jgi:hypothetical protein